MFDTLVSAGDAKSLIDRGADVVLLDARFDLAEPASGRRAYAAGHLPGARYVHLDEDLSGPRHDAEGRFLGRHPLPSPAAFAALAGQLGIEPSTQVIAYDASGGMFAARAWWLLRWIGHCAVAVLDGGLPAWTAAGGGLSTEPVAVDAARPPYPAAHTAEMSVAPLDEVVSRLGRMTLVDARAPERYRGDAEPLDRVAGHIPGARNRFFQHNLGPDGRFKPSTALRDAWQQLIGAAAPAEVVHQCGSGVTACHNLLAMEAAGLPGSRLYPGSWSEWCADPARPVARG